MNTDPPSDLAAAPSGDPPRSDLRWTKFCEWLREVSALLVVFPIIDQLVVEPGRSHFNWWVALSPTGFGLIFLIFGITLEPRRR